MSRVLVLRLLRVIGSVGLGPRVVRGAMLSVAGSTEMVCAFWRHQDLKRLANMGGKRGAIWMMNARDEDVCCFDCSRIAHPTRHRFGPSTPCFEQHGGNRRTEHEELRDRPRVRVTANGIGSALPDVSFTFGIVFNCCVGAVSAYPKQEFSAVPDTDDPEDAQLESSCEGKRGTLKANTFGCNLF